MKISHLLHRVPTESFGLCDEPLGELHVLVGVAADQRPRHVILGGEVVEERPATDVGHLHNCVD